MNQDHEHYHKPAAGTTFWGTRHGLATIMAIGIVVIYLLTEHLGHVYQALPWVILAASPILYIFMHREHGGHGPDGDGSK